MKTLVLAVIYLAFGIGLGIWSSTRDFVGEVLPTKAFLAYFDEQQSPAKERVGPHLVVVKGETHDFGSLPLWAKRKHTFVVSNDGTEPLRLVMGKPTCSCTAAEELQEGDELEVPPGEQKEITLEWEIRTSVVQFAQSAPFTTNDPKRKYFVLAIIGRVEDAVTRSRETVTFTNVPSSLSVVESVRLDTNQTDKLSIVNHRWLNPEIAGFFDVKFEAPTAEEAKQATGRATLMVRVTLKPGLRPGRFDQTLELTTNMAPAIPPFHVPIAGIVVGDIMVFGPGVRTDARTVTLGDILQGNGITRTISVAIKGPHRRETQLSVAKVDPAILRVQVGEPDDSKPNVRFYPVTIAVPKDAPLDNRGGGGEDGRTGLVVLNTTHPSVPQLELAVFYIVRE